MINRFLGLGAGLRAISLSSSSSSMSISAICNWFHRLYESATTNKVPDFHVDNVDILVASSSSSSSSSSIL
jgi:hypothetical protein